MRMCPSSGTPEVRRAKRSEPASGSLKSWHHSSAPAAMGARYRAFCAGVPMATSSGVTIEMPTMLTEDVAPARAISSACTRPIPTVRSRPPNSAGQSGTGNPAAASSTVPGHDGPHRGLVVEMVEDRRRMPVEEGPQLFAVGALLLVEGQAAREASERVSAHRCSSGSPAANGSSRWRTAAFNP